MRKITQYSTHTYTTKGSAMRAARNLIGETASVEGHTVVLTAEMFSVEQWNGGWRWVYTCEIPGSEPVEVVSETPPTAPAPTPSPTVPATLPELTERVEQYWDSMKAMISVGRDADAAAYREREEPPLLDACWVLGTSIAHVIVALDTVNTALESTNPGWMAEVALDVAPFGLDTRIQDRLEEQSRRRGVPVSKYMQLAAEKLQRRAA